MPSSLWRRPVVLIGLAISGLAVGIFVASFDLGLVRQSLLAVKGWTLAVAGIVFLGSYMVRGLRWKLLLEPLARLPYGQVRNVLMTGFMLNCLLPARAGEIARPLVLWRVAGTSRRGGLATVGLERIFDLLCLVGLVVVVGLLFEVPDEVRRSSLVAAVLMLAGLVVTAWLAYHHPSFFRLFDRALFFLPPSARSRVVAFFERFVDGTASLRDLGLVARVSLLSLLIWGMEAVVYHAVMYGFGLALPPWCSIIVLAATNFGIAAPSAPGHVGVFEAACASTVFALSRILGRSTSWELALSFALGVHLLLFSCVVGAGLVMMWQLGLRFADVVRAGKTGGNAKGGMRNTE